MAEKPFGKFYTVSKLTREIKTLLEDKYPFIWVTGEISNYAVPVSGHSYFSLKDESAMIQAVMFKNQKRGLKFLPENGMKIFGLARLTLYEPRGNYQLIFEHIEPAGAGSAQVAFEQLKARLEQKGFFDVKFKKKPPFLPAKVCIITSRTGAALRDILNVIIRRFPDMAIDIIPVKVQGQDAARQICRALEIAQEVSVPDVIILARGGGSIEDLSAFNSEEVANSMFLCKIPIIAGIGHETDFTIADFVADLRAPTPSAAAELGVPEKIQLAGQIEKLTQRLNAAVLLKVAQKKEYVQILSQRLKNPNILIYNAYLVLEDIDLRLKQAVKKNFKSKKQQMHIQWQKLIGQNPVQKMKIDRAQVNHMMSRLDKQMAFIFQKNKNRFQQAQARLEAMSPLSVLDRGYSITRKLCDQHIVTDCNDVKTDDDVQIILAKGHIIAKVKETHGKEKNI